MRTETTPQRTPGPPLLIGEAPPPGGLGPLGPFDCASGDALARLLREADPERGRPGSAPWTRERALSAFARRNLLPEWPGRAGRGKGSAFPVAAARRAATDLLGSTPRGAQIVLAGQRVADAFGLRAPIGAQVRYLGATWTVIPHPSGASQAYNDPTVRELAGAVLHRAIMRCAAEQAAEIDLDGSARYHYGWGQFTGDLERARRALDAAALRVFRWCATSPVTVRAHEALCALRAYLRCLALGLPVQVAVRSAAIALVHDRHEPLAGDLASPVKPLLADDWRPLEQAAARAVADLFAGCAPLGSPLRPLHDVVQERAADEQAHLADLDAAPIEAAWWVPHAPGRIAVDPLHAAAVKAAPRPGRDMLQVLEVAAAGLDRAAWRGYEDLRAALDALACELPALPVPGEEVSLAR